MATGAPAVAARAAQSSYSGIAATTRPRQRFSLTRAAPQGVSTVANARPALVRVTGVARTPSVVVPSISAAASAGASAGTARTPTVIAGRPFFMTIGVSQASSAPAAKSRSRSGA